MRHSLSLPTVTYICLRHVQTMSHLMTCDDAPNSTWTDLAIPTLALCQLCQTLEESIYQQLSSTLRRRSMLLYYPSKLFSTVLVISSIQSPCHLVRLGHIDSVCQSVLVKHSQIIHVEYLPDTLYFSRWT